MTGGLFMLVEELLCKIMSDVEADELVSV